MVWSKLVTAVCALGVAAAGCASPGELGAADTIAVSMTLDPSEWSDVQLTALYHAAARWNAFGGHELVRLETVDGPRKTHHIRPATLPEHFSGMHSPALETIRIDVGQAEDNFETVVVHELGHALGMDHIPEAGIMYTVVDGSIVDFTTADHAECERVGWCAAAETR